MPSQPKIFLSVGFILKRCSAAHTARELKKKNARYHCPERLTAILSAARVVVVLVSVAIVFL